jgi:hypothetical protein
MAEGISSVIANGTLNAVFNNTSFSVAQAYVQLHTGAPGAAGTANVAGNATRKSVSMGVASGGAITNDVAISWTAGEVDTSEDYTHVSFWDASTSGNFLGSGLNTSNPVTVGDTYTIGVGDLDVAFPLAS